MQGILAVHTLYRVVFIKLFTWKAECDCGWDGTADSFRAAQLAHVVHVDKALHDAGFGKLP